MPGDVLIQVYVHCDSPFAPLHPRLCGFKKVSLNAGEKITVHIPLDPLTETVIDDTGNPVKAESYTLYVGISQPDEYSVSLSGVKPLEISKQASKQ